MPRSSGSLVAALVVFAGLSFFATRFANGGDDVGAEGSEACLELGTCGVDDGVDTEWSASLSSPPEEPPALGPEVCRGAGYLCSGLGDRGDPRVMRWADGMREIRVRVLPPAHEPASRRRAYQSAVINGIRTWTGTPFPIRILRDERGEADFEVRWTSSLGGDQLGVTSTVWRSGPSGTGMEVTALTLATRAPRNAQQHLDPAQVGLTAAHEMGHALGLPHSDSPRDVMYPTNTAARISAADYQTMNALYSLPNGARIELPGR